MYDEVDAPIVLEMLMLLQRIKKCCKKILKALLKINNAISFLFTVEPLEVVNHVQLLLIMFFGIVILIITITVIGEIGIVDADSYFNCLMLF